MRAFTVEWVHTSTMYLYKDEAAIMYPISHINGLLLHCDVSFFCAARRDGRSKQLRAANLNVQTTHWIESSVWGFHVGDYDE
jgi:hypothetical protein